MGVIGRVVTAGSADKPMMGSVNLGNQRFGGERAGAPGYARGHSWSSTVNGAPIVGRTASAGVYANCLCKRQLSAYPNNLTRSLQR